MFYLDGTYRYWLYNKPVDMRKSFTGLSGIVTNAMSGHLYGGEEVISASLAYENVVGMVHSALDSPYVRRMKMLAKSL